MECKVECKGAQELLRRIVHDGMAPVVGRFSFDAVEKPQKARKKEHKNRRLLRRMKDESQDEWVFISYKRLALTLK